MLSTSLVLADGQTPRPTPRPRPEPNPPAPQPPQPQPPQPTPPNRAVEAARRAGTAAGQTAGALEGRERGNRDGEPVGRREGEQQGYNRCYEEERDRQRDLGIHEGHRIGDREGTIAGEHQGSIDGRARGEHDGRVDGEKRADRDAQAAATGPGSAQGTEEANSSDARERGNADGAAAGDRQAMERARTVDYPRGRKSYQDERFAEEVQNRDEFSQKPGPNPAPLASNSLSTMKTKDIIAKNLGESSVENVRADVIASNVAPDDRYYKPAPNFNTAEETAAYNQGYRAGYNSGFSSDYTEHFNRSRRIAHDEGVRDGCTRARRQNFRAYYDRGYREGHERGYRLAYQRSYDRVLRLTYDAVFGSASEAAHRATYPGAYQRHFEAARQAAYARRVDELYRSTFDAARTRVFNEKYPIYADSEFKRGVQDEAEDFRLRPVRILAVEATETIQNGALEPGEGLRLKLSLRNFSAQGIEAKDLKIQLRADNNQVVAISEPESSLQRNLREKSVTAVKEALEFRFFESSVNQKHRLTVTLVYQGRVIGTQALDLTPRFQLGLALTERPALKEGLPMPIRVTVTNQSDKPSDIGTRITLVSDPKSIELVDTSKELGVLGPKESRVLEFRAIARSSGDYVQIPIAFSASGSAGRRVGVLDLSSQVPLVNDYKITVTNSIEGLRRSGLTRANYRIRNVSSRLLMKGVQLKIRVIDTDEVENFDIIGPNPQYLLPIEQNRTSSFVVPVISKENNSGGKLELEVQEDGQTVVVHQLEF